MNRRVVAVSLVAALGISAVAAAQTGAGSLRGYVKDEQGGALPGVTVSARSESLIQPVSSVSDAEGYFRLINLPPGTYEVSAQLAGFASFKRQDIIVRAGANFQVDIAMRLASITERFQLPVQVTEDDEGGWTRTFSVSKVPSTYLINARRKFVWSREGDVDPGELAAALEKHATPAPAPRARPLRLAVSPGERAPD